MISNSLLQAAIIARLKAATNVIDILGGEAEVREQQWQGRQFTYPAVRVNLANQVPLIPLSPCDWSRLAFSVFCLSEGTSSFEADDLAGAVNADLHNAAWTPNLAAYRFFYVRSVGLNSAIRMSERVWRAEAFFQADIHTL